MITLSRFRGCLLGALAGDCLGSPYEGEFSWTLENGIYNEEQGKKFRNGVVQFVNEFPKGYERKPIRYTDDTAMMRSVAESLITNDEFNPRDMAKKFAETYFNDAFRGYGGNVVLVFENLKKTQYKDPYEPAKQQFGGSGSYGNGGSMRVAPAALFYAKNLSKALEAAKNQCLLTHIHPDGVMGSVLQAAAVHLALNSDIDKLEQKDFIGKLCEIMEKQENAIYPNLKLPDDNPFNKKLKAFDSLLDDNASNMNVAHSLGTGIAALRSVPAAIFSFVRCLKPCEEIKIENPLIRTLAYAISLGGDTDTIATMAGAIAGAYYGDSYIPHTWINALEGAVDYSNYATYFKKKFDSRF